jgi:spore coat protein U-like protein
MGGGYNNPASAGKETEEVMRKSITVFIALAVLAAGGAAWAADSTTVAVSATVTPVCKFNSSGAISFALDPSVGGNVPGAITQPTFWCTKSVSYTLGDDFGVNEAVANTAPRRMKHALLGEYIPYSFTYTTTGTGNGASSPITMDIASQVLGTDYASASSGAYSDTVTLTIAP